MAIFSFLTVVCNSMGDEITPFFVWGMYSEKESPLNSYNTFKIQVNDNTLIDHTSGYTAMNRFFLSSPLSYYRRMGVNGFIDPSLSFLHKKLGSDNSLLNHLADRITNGHEQQKLFLGWFKRYLEQSTSIRIHSLKIDAIKLHFTTDKQVQADSIYLFAAWEQD